MAREAAPTRWPARHGPRRHAANPRVDAGVKELNEMTIGRTEDPENPSLAPAFVAASLFGAGPRNPSGPADMVPRQQAGHMHAIDHPSRSFSSCIPGAVHTCEERSDEAISMNEPYRPEIRNDSKNQCVRPVAL